ncbi:c-type cytochrome [bacterium]|nr:c-type cytochrome [bacterium]MBU1959386.1 c-type cytochrome [bacterium]
MKKLTVLSIVAASLLLVGCGDSATGAEAKAAAKPAVETAAPAAAEATKSAATEAKEAAAVVVEKTTEAVTETVAEAKDAVVETAATATEAVAEVATEAKDAVVETATAAVETTTEAASAVAEKATEAVAAATGPDGKALYAKCAGCHGADGKTAALGKSAVIAGQTAADLETKIAGYKAGTLNVAGMGALMKGQVATYSDEDIKAVSGYIAGL